MDRNKSKFIFPPIFSAQRFFLHSFLVKIMIPPTFDDRRLSRNRRREITYVNDVLMDEIRNCFVLWQNALYAISISQNLFDFYFQYIDYNTELMYHFPTMFSLD